MQTFFSSLRLIHKTNHRANLGLAAVNRHKPALHAQFLEAAAVNRFYFKELKNLSERRDAKS